MSKAQPAEEHKVHEDETREVLSGETEAEASEPVISEEPVAPAEAVVGADQAGVDVAAEEEPAAEHGESEESGESGESGEPTPAGAALVEDKQRVADERKLADTEARLRAVSAAYKTLRDEMRAYQERTERLKEEMDRRRRGEAVVAIFEPVQNLRRSLEAFKRMEVSEEVIQGVDLVLDQFLKALDKLGLEEIHAEGAVFDPNVHEAMGTVVVTRPELDGRVLQVFDSGYRIGSMVVQPARVIIGAFQEPPAEE